MREPCGLNLHSIFVNFSGVFPSNIQDVLCLVHQMKTGPLKPSRSGHGKVCFFFVPGTYKHTCIRTEKHQNG